MLFNVIALNEVVFVPDDDVALMQVILITDVELIAHQ